SVIGVSDFIISGCDYIIAGTDFIITGTDYRIDRHSDVFYAYVAHKIVSLKNEFGAVALVALRKRGLLSFFY
ncbi:hypothetical protein, partial [uncultured Parabacteroides sp.]|uniref:hypothetical protein n=1 Tax=uncultured Parabacteroides sp. TaxID=512312 RepID=UPI00262EF46F